MIFKYLLKTLKLKKIYNYIMYILIFKKDKRSAEIENHEDKC